MPLFFGYPGAVWAAAYASLDWLQSQLNNAATPAAATNAASVVFQTLRNGSEAINIYQAARAANIGESNLSQIAALTLSLDPVTQAYFTARYVSMGNFMVALDAMQVAIPSPPLVPGLLANGSPAIAYGGLLEYYMNPLAVTGGLIETPPTGLSSSTFAADTALNATVYQTLAQAVAAVQGTNLTLAYDAATQMYSAGCMALKRQSDFTSNGFNFTGAYSPAQMWNLQVALPSILNVVNMITSSPQSAMRHNRLYSRSVYVSTCGLFAFAPAERAKSGQSGSGAAERYRHGYRRARDDEFRKLAIRRHREQSVAALDRAGIARSARRAVAHPVFERAIDHDDTGQLCGEYPWHRFRFWADQRKHAHLAR